MYHWIIYDIRNDRTRCKVARWCKQAGLQRVQKSVFLGPLNQKKLTRLRTDFNRIVNWRTDKVFFVPMSEGGYRRVQQSGARRRPPLLDNTLRPALY